MKRNRSYSSEVTRIRNTTIPPTLFLCCVLLSFLLPCTSALDLHCPVSRIPSSPNTSIPLGSAAADGTWCCPSTNPTLLLDEFVMPNDPQYNYTDINGVLFQKLPRCAACPAATGWNICSRTIASYRISYCCQSEYTCSTSQSVCMKKNSTDFIYGSNAIYEAAVPIIDLDLCRFRKASDGSKIPGSPCPSQIECEAFSQSQYRCQICTDSRVSPPGLCNMFTCPRGSFCFNMNELDVTTTSQIIETTCPVGSWCGFNASLPTPCPPGHLCDAPGLSAPLGCAAENYCLDGIHQIPCPVGSYCDANSSQPTACRVGTYCPFAGMSAPSQCPLGSYCNTTSTAQPCEPGFICPWRNMTAPIACQLPQFCPKWNMTAAGICPAGFYCSNVTTQRLCPPGMYCLSRAVAPTPCQNGEFNDWPGQSTCKPCNSRWVTSGEGATHCSVYTSTSIGLICGGVAFVFVVILAAAIFAHFHAKRRKALQLEEEEKRIEEEDRIAKVLEIAHRQAAALDERAKQVMELAAEQYRAQVQAQEAAKKQFDSDRVRIKADVIVRLLRDLRTDVKLHYPHAAALVIPGPAAAIVMKPLAAIEEESGEGASNSLTDDHTSQPSPPVSSQNTSVTLLQQYTNFLQDLLEPIFEVQFSELWSALNVLVDNPQQCTPIDLNYALLGVKSLVVESFPTFQSSVEATSLADGSAMQSIIRDQLLRELNQHIRAWLIKVVNSTSNNNNNATPSLSTPSSARQMNGRYLPPLENQSALQQRFSTFSRPYITVPQPASVTSGRVMPFTDSESPIGSPSKVSGVSLSQSAALRYLVAVSDGNAAESESFNPCSSSSNGESLPGMV